MKKLRLERLFKYVFRVLVLRLYFWIIKEILQIKSNPANKYFQSIPNVWHPNISGFSTSSFLASQTLTSIDLPVCRDQYPYVRYHTEMIEWVQYGPPGNEILYIFYVSYRTLSCGIPGCYKVIETKIVLLCLICLYNLRKTEQKGYETGYPLREHA